MIFHDVFACVFVQLLERSRARRKRLEDALDDIQGNISLLEDLIAYLSDAEVLLLTKEEDETPEDMSLVEDLLKQHMVCLLVQLFADYLYIDDGLFLAVSMNTCSFYVK